MTNHRPTKTHLLATQPADKRGCAVQLFLAQVHIALKLLLAGLQTLGAADESEVWMSECGGKSGVLEH